MIAALEDEFLTMASYHAVANKPRTLHAQSFSRGNAIVVRCEGSRRACPHRHLRGRRCDRLVPASHHLAAQDDGASVGACKGRLAFLLVDKIIQMIPSAFEDFREVWPCCEDTKRQICTTLMSAFASSRQVNSWLSFKHLLQALQGKAGGTTVMTTVDHTLMRGSEPHDR